jgi:hypothetical protein
MYMREEFSGISKSDCEAGDFFKDGKRRLSSSRNSCLAGFGMAKRREVELVFHVTTIGMAPAETCRSISRQSPS